MKITRICAVVTLLCSLSLTSFAQDEPDLFPGGTYNPDIPTPFETTGHKFGALHTYYWEMERFLNAVNVGWTLLF
jgi:hypothetical protein